MKHISEDALVEKVAALVGYLVDPSSASTTC
jgi:hypothetical protein